MGILTSLASLTRGASPPTLPSVLAPTYFPFRGYSRGHTFTRHQTPGANTQPPTVLVQLLYLSWHRLGKSARHDKHVIKPSPGKTLQLPVRRGHSREYPKEGVLYSRTHYPATNDKIAAKVNREKSRTSILRAYLAGGKRTRTRTSGSTHRHHFWPLAIRKYPPGSKCVVTHHSSHSTRIASHTKPWKQNSNFGSENCVLHSRPTTTNCISGAQRCTASTYTPVGVCLNPSTWALLETANWRH